MSLCTCKCHIHVRECCDECKNKNDLESINNLIWKLDAKYQDAFAELSKRVHILELELHYLKTKR